MKITGAIVIACALMSLTEAAVTLTSEQKARLDGAKAQCAQQTGTDIQVIQKLRNGEFPDDPKFNDFLVCLAKIFNFQNEAGELQTDVIVQKLGSSINDASKARQLTEKCLPNGSSGYPVYQFAKCVYDSTPEHIIIVQ